MISIEDRRTSVELIHEAERNGARRSRACPVLNISVRTLQRWEQGLVDQRKAAAAHRNPGNKLLEEERKQVMNVVNQPEFASLPPSRIVPTLADRGEYLCSERTMYRILSEGDQNNERGRAQRATQQARPAPLQARAPNEVWSWDITYLRSAVKGQFFYLYLIMDIYSRKVVGWEVHEEESAEHASMLVSKACLAEGVHRAGLALHSDNGSPMKGATMLGTLQRLGVVPSFSRPSVSNDNPYSESLFRTLKYVPNYPRKPFADIGAARKWVHSFVRWYNQEHLHSAIKFVTPTQKHCGQDIELLKNRAQVYQTAKAARPERWSGQTRDWSPVTEVHLNPERGEVTTDRQSKAA